jgi:7-cyano-7-deazaguanine synthase
MIDAIVLLSGGMDSAALLYYAVRNMGLSVLAIGFDYGSKHAKMEIRSARIIAESLGVEYRLVELPLNTFLSSDLLVGGEDIPEGEYSRESLRRTVVPCRNAIMISICSGIASSVGARSVMIGSHSGDHAIYADCRPEFNDAIRESIEIATDHMVTISFPWQSHTKAEIIKDSEKMDLSVPWEFTYSCYRGGMKHCGKCSTCLERKNAFAESGVEDMTQYD